jgi:hypothetical protein
VIKRKILKGIVLWVVGLIWLGLLPVSQSMAQVDRVVQVTIDYCQETVAPTRGDRGQIH